MREDAWNIEAKAGAIRYASSGVAGFNHFGGELFNNLAGVQMTHVPYKGGRPSMTDVMGGQVEVGFGTLTQVLPLSSSPSTSSIPPAIWETG